MTLEEVIAGLLAGKSFKHRLEDDPGWEYVTTHGRNVRSFSHDIVGENNGGWGGHAELPISILQNKAWADDGWERK